MQTYVDDRPLDVVVTGFTPGDDGNPPLFSRDGQLIDIGDPPCPPEVVFALHDPETGERSTEIEAQLTDSDHRRITAEIQSHMEKTTHEPF